jgi:hypothetical protein
MRVAARERRPGEAEMPAKDRYHEAVRAALIKYGWTVTDDPLTLRYHRRDIHIDIGAERLLAAERGAQGGGRMETVARYRELVLQILAERARHPYVNNGDYERELVIDRENDRYLLITIGWEGERRVYYTVYHVDIREGKLWIQHDATDRAIASDLAAAGVPKEHIVLAFYPEEARCQSEFAAA